MLIIAKAQRGKSKETFFAIFGVPITKVFEQEKTELTESLLRISTFSSCLL